MKKYCELNFSGQNKIKTMYISGETNWRIPALFKVKLDDWEGDIASYCVLPRHMTLSKSK